MSASGPRRPGEPGRSDDEHESRCRRCGISCHLALPINGVPVVIPSLRCRHLAQEGASHFRCTVYERRFEVAPWCHHADLALQEGLLAADCPYAAGVPGVRGKQVLPEARLSRLWPFVLAELLRVGVPDFIDQAAFLRDLERREGRSFSLSPSRRMSGRLDVRPV